MSCIIEVIDRKTRQVVKTLGPMSERKAGRVESGLLMNMDTDNYFVQTVEVVNEVDTDLSDTQPMIMGDE